MLTYQQRAAEVMLHLVTHSAHGYSQPNRAGDGTIETLVLSDGTTTTVHGGDYDCSEAVRMCYVAAGVIPRGTYMWTGNEQTTLLKYGFKRVALTGLQVGDVLLRSGHTEMVVSVGGALKQAGFRMSEHRSTNGTKGDQTGWESAYSALVPSAWSWAYRYVGAQPQDGDKMEPHDVWEYDYRHTAFGGNMYNTLMETHELAQPHNHWEYHYDQADGTNTAPGGNMYNCAVETHGLAESAQPHNVWEYDYKDAEGKSTAPGGNMYNCMVAIYNTVTTMQGELADLQSRLEALEKADTSEAKEA
ncbi:MAG: peptidoglycan amidohydrolase family protein [Parafannyhessea sp.]|uniref:peptidoglycan amidohydrolase family protein n=1 Tax=Parafannyhessea sp. TaxID=2847324 RepID=UPI003F03689D